MEDYKHESLDKILSWKKMVDVAKGHREMNKNFFIIW
jgi:hypothetical protein